jgi:HAD superfamily phosphoserine phosphatase-like hydrolase
MGAKYNHRVFYSVTDKPVLAIFDLDRTITKSGTYTPCLLGWALRRAPWRLLLTPLAALLMLAYVARLMSREDLKIRMLQLLVGRAERDALNHWADRFAARWIPRHCHRHTLAEISRLRQAGVNLALATASFDWCASAFGRALGIELVIATGSVWDSTNRLGFAIDGRNCYGAEKLRMVEAALAKSVSQKRDQLTVWFYTDHHSDLPCLAWADRAIVVNPTAKLQAIAADRGFDRLA